MNTLDGKKLEEKSAEEVLKWVVDKYEPHIAIASSFGMEDVTLIYMASRIKNDVKIIYLNTGYQFEETDKVKEEIKEKYNANIIEYSPKITIEQQKEKYGDKLWETNPDLCCKIRKLEPLERSFRELKLTAWITGMRREQSPTRKNIKKVDVDKNGLIKINPLADWTSEEVRNYVKLNNIPYNSLFDKGYTSIGCKPCTNPIKKGEDERSGRWSGKEKIECGIHL